jgi:fructose-bisphosphate aldolase, class II
MDYANISNRLDDIRKEINGRLRIAMHGTNGFKEDVMKECIKRGVSKVNVNKLVLDDYHAYIQANASTVTLTQLQEVGVEKARKLCEWQMDVCGSTGKAK